jgi:dTDP-4-dehydrorhamnose reductase
MSRDYHWKCAKSLINKNFDNKYVKKILLTGVNGQVGHALSAQLTQHQVIPLTRAQLDLTNLDDISRIVREIKPDIIINAAAYTAVDKAESEPELCFAVNATAVRVLAEEAARLNASLIHFSTDYVFNGEKQSPYLETDSVNAKNTYGKSKLAGEQAIAKVGLPYLILRTSWIYSTHGNNFLKNILRLAQERDSLRVVCDQHGSPTSSQCIANGVVQLLNTWQVDREDQAGIYHLTNTGVTTWHGFSREIINIYNGLQNQRRWPALKTPIEKVFAVSSQEYPTPAIRPANSRLDNTKLKQVFNVELPSWQQGLQQVMQTLTL